MTVSPGRDRRDRTLDDVLAGLHLPASGARHAQTGIWAAAALRGLIADGKLAPGTKLSEEALCGALGVSRNTLREAFSALAAERLVTRIPNRGVYVARPTADDIREIYRVRHYLEPAALTWSHATDFTPLRRAVERAGTARDAGSADGMADANQDFHAAIVALGHSDRLDLLMAQVLAEMRLVFNSMVADSAFHTPYVEDNARIVELLEAGRRGEAAALLTDYLRRAEAQLLDAMAANVEGARPGTAD